MPATDASNYDPAIIDELVAQNGGSRFVVQSSVNEDGQPTGAQIVMVTRTVAEAQAIAALFPKSVKVRATEFTTHRKGQYHENFVLGYVHLPFVQLATNGVNGGRNETGLKRLRSFYQACLKHNLPVDFDVVLNYKNPATPAQRRQLLGAE